MHFQTGEYYFKDSLWKKIWEVISGYLMLLYLPIAYGKHLLEKMHGVVEPELRQQGVWLEHTEYENLKVWSCALNNEEGTKIIESETLAFPFWKDWEDPFRFILKFKTEPGLPDLEKMYFDEVDLLTESGIYLIKINEKGSGMTLCFLSGIESKLYEIKHLKSLSWIIEQTEVDTIRLTGYSDTGKHIIKIKLVITTES